MREYERSFKEVDKAASQLLGQLADHVRDYTQTTKQGFEQLVARNVEIESKVCSMSAWQESASDWPHPNAESCSHDCAPRSCESPTLAVLACS
jgi:hypothetical protein